MLGMEGRCPHVRSYKCYSLLHPGKNNSRPDEWPLSMREETQWRSINLWLVGIVGCSEQQSGHARSAPKE
uniref:Uncharacterized protein n=1 Tax=Triticum urartu TaxID=4572 RepID=A0A8R7PNX5_TRIUA